MSETDSFETDELLAQPPDGMRRVPQQERSRRMVNAIVDAAHMILLEHGREGLTTTILEQVSGVSKASIYQYFPNLNAVIAEVFHLVIRRCQIHGYREYPYDQQQTVFSFTEWLIDWALEVHRSVIKVDRDFYFRYCEFYDMWQELDRNLGPDDSTEHFIYEQLMKCSDFKASSNDMMLVHAIGRSAQFMVYSLIRDNPEFLDRPSFKEMLIRMSYAIFSEDNIITK